MSEDTITRHPSYGVMSITRVSGSGKHLFGATVDHQSSIRIRISKAHIQRSLNTDRVRDDEPVVDVELSPLQWAEALTTLGVMPGVPVTIRRIGEEVIAKCPPCNDRQKIEAEFAAKITGVMDDLRSLQKTMLNMFSKKNALTRADKDALLTGCGRAITEIGSNMPFVHEMFREAMDKTVAEAKAAIDAFYQHAIVEAGLAALTDRSAVAPSLPRIELHEQEPSECA
jgi:hypothetical protein